MSLNSEVACAARWMNSRIDRLPENERPDAGELWERLVDALEDSRSEGSQELAVLAWRDSIAKELGDGE